MGGVLSSPVEIIHVQRQGSETFRSAVAEMQGFRSGHEDAHEMACGDGSGAFWVLDGHGGENASLIGAPKLKQEFAELMAKNDGTLPDDERISKGMIDVDQQIRDYFKLHPEKESGSTVVGALIAKQSDGTYKLKLVNCGDSRALVVRSTAEQESTCNKVTLRTPQHLVDLKGDPVAIAKEFCSKDCEWPLVQETIDHKPSHPTEKNRIEAGGGHVTEDDPPRLDGNLAVSRGLGDFEFKQSLDAEPSTQKVSCIPDIYEVEGLAPGSICVLCCDGVWDVLTGPEVGVMVRDVLCRDVEADLGDIAASIVRESLKRNSRDNVTAMVVQMSGGGEWHTKEPKNEMKCYEKLKRVAGEADAPDEEVRKQYHHFLDNHGFRHEPCECDVCAKWYQDMMQCPCKQVYYCTKSCQKKGWKKHKPGCPLANSPSPSGGTPMGKALSKKK
mmetsp:Transcript_83835/g.241037  ORF Transcript_83835/g.241037 Transcript_83835/m.241037 type:complete len:443 (+) Transcript_83835:77-1405(+)|eukprot:CAMPEP_0177323332 /NCGR_PEP_ID=MMETSP0368-20130122/16688_1 /TAXON_ID=447022 ORGANISM="Scrippsiella hangoei-like, Strain SHHI-4" /NCGR_SAMPLE_ID=MMETSP0368 /ASSEMBLY_ACC=CAM_ASM_000363 /LENGTH=442 /DNA_ID=CAMNT_0018783095 /DNA_START=68 /DNA_END=1396 /DNA_ORIENTATION=+